MAATETAATPEARRKTWIRIATFLVLVTVFTLLSTAVLKQVHLPKRLSACIGMWVPGTCAIVVKLLFDRSLTGLGLARSGGVKGLLMGLLIPVAYALPVYVIVWLVGAGGLDPSRWGTAIPYFSDPGNAATALGLLLTVGLVDKLGRALGEEIGWRGFLVPEFLKLMPLWQTGLVTGAIWFCWHLPAIFFQDYNSSTAGGPPLAYQIGCFAAMVIPSGILYAWLRQRTGSVWPCALLHASHNLVIQSILDQGTVNAPRTLWITGEFGFGLALTTWVTVLAILLLANKPAPQTATA
ncbi:MAG TPA: type II CAAX endopeptidase family protein [Caulobacteraceae bacterium]|jgi:membrane protease YdiL (CAAX protease family)